MGRRTSSAALKVTTSRLLSRDGVHPSNPKKYQDDYSEEALRSHGYGLRNYLVLMKYAEVLEAFSMP